MVFAIDVGRDPNVRTALPHGFVAQPSERCLERRAAHVTRQSHATRTSSRTKCNRISLGRGIVSSK